ncbi:phosphatidylinositol 4-phosphate 5-kinase 3 [Elysia marginata]|uniref:Phosphatidylinositol 4-phosphate 5-kinase 3 n=1 Tax=Elysia marginata TaxID=1093978 RepID=A0AAV4H3K3_9GAST|nr:phosphatidylinositol 4-phosphate 5-kinase 3 [Elysia marginata]
MEQAVRTRAAAKGCLTRASAEIESLLSEVEADPESVTESALVDCMEQFSKRLSAYDEAQGKTVESLWALHDKLQSNIRSLESLGVSGNAYGVILTPMVLHRLPESVHLEWARVGKGKESDLEELLQLFMEIQRRERRDREERKPGATAATLHSASDKKNDGPSCDSQTEVDILVGLDYYWGLVKPGSTLLSDHLAIQETKFGYVLSGSWDINKGNAQQRVPNGEDSTNPILHLPHRPVIREASATTRIRPVFDASCKAFNGYSLNDCVESGPNLIPNLVEVLLRFRRWRYGLTADISKTFLQIRVCEQDQDVRRFVWDVRNQVRVMRFDRVVFGDASSTFLLNATIKYHLTQFHDSMVVSELRENLYVDDWLSGSDSQDEIVKMASEAENILAQGGFPLAKWGSNSFLVGDRVVSYSSKDCSKTLPRL